MNKTQQPQTLESVMFPNAIKTLTAKEATIKYFSELRKSQKSDSKISYLDGILKACLFLCSERQDFNSNTLLNLTSHLNADLAEIHKVVLEYAEFMRKKKYLTIRNPVFPMWIWI